MEKDDVQLIRKVLLGDNEAFSALVRKYQKGVHALAWRKVKLTFIKSCVISMFIKVL